MARIRQRKGQRYTLKSPDEVLIETGSAPVLRGRLVNVSDAGMRVSVEGERPTLVAKQKVRVRCRTGYGTAKVVYLEESSPNSFCLGIRWDG